MILLTATPPPPPTPPLPPHALHNLLDHQLYFLELLKKLVFPHLSSVTLPDPQLSFNQIYFFLDFFSSPGSLSLRGDTLVSDAFPHVTQEVHQCLMAHWLLLRYCVCLMALRLGLCFSGYCLMFYSGVRQVKVSPGRHPCNSPRLKYRGDEPPAPRGGSETGKRADGMAKILLRICVRVSLEDGRKGRKEGRRGRLYFHSDSAGNPDVSQSTAGPGYIYLTEAK